MKTLEEIETQLAAEITAALARGLKLVNFRFGDGIETCCAVTAGDKRDEVELGYVQRAAKRFGIASSDVWSIILGFDNVTNFEGSAEFYAVGRRLRQRFLP